MRKLVFIFLAGAAIVALDAFARGRWDSQMQRVGTISASSGSASLQVRTTPGSTDYDAPYVKTVCNTLARVGVGTSAISCAAQGDGGQPCELIRYDLGEKHYAAFSVTATHVAAAAADGGAFSCDVLKAVE